MPINAGVLAPDQHGIAVELDAVAGNNEAPLAAPLDNRRQLRATLRPEIDVSGIATRHYLVTSSTMLRDQQVMARRTVGDVLVDLGRDAPGKIGINVGDQPLRNDGAAPQFIW